MTTSTSLPYRPDVDGLRSIAVVLVVLFHAGFDSISGGFIGVDVFFVVSGYLITSLISREMERQSFSYADFLLRRVRRILPASFTVMTCTAIVFGFVYPPSYFQDLGAALFTQSLFSSNFFFWREQGYFSTASELQPLLHTWSLAVEEQFYLVFPGALWLTFKIRRPRRIALVALVFLLSLGLSVLISDTRSLAAFYLLPTRAWELLAGALLALSPRNPDAEPSPFRQLVGILGLFCIVLSALQFDASTPFPSYTALVPVLGTTAIIWAGQGRPGILARLLGMPPLVRLGLISYSLYLWHWPIFVLNRWLHEGEPSTMSIIASIAIAGVLAVISYRYIEEPIRRKRVWRSPRALIMATGVWGIFLGVLGLTIFLSDGLPSRNEAAASLSERADFQQSPRRIECLNRFARDPNDFVCQSTSYQSSSSPPFFVWGDSHADALIPAFQEAADRLDRRFQFATYTGCPAIPGVYRFDDKSRLCTSFNDAVLTHLLEAKIAQVFLVFRHNLYTQGLEGQAGDLIRPLDTTNESGLPPSQETAFNTFAEGFDRLIERLRESGIEVYVVRQVPVFSQDPSYEIKRATMMGLRVSSETVSTSRAEFERRSRPVVDHVRNLRVKLVDFSDHLCDAEKCYAVRDGVSLYLDDDHLGPFGCAYLVEPIRRVLATLRPSG